MTDDTENTDDRVSSDVSRRQVLQGTAAAGVLSLLSTTGASAQTTEVVVRAEAAEVPLLASSASVVDELKATAGENQQSIVEYVEKTDGLAVKNRFWLANAVLLEIDTERVNPEELTARKGVSEVHPNFAFELPEPESTAAAAENAEVTYGLDQIDAPEVWETYGSRGEGARIAVLDTGIDPDHPDIDIAAENFAEFDGDGNVVDSEPHDSHYHGTHVSGTVAGGDASGTAIGVAPDAELLNALILPEGGGTFAQIIAGMQWAVEQDADAMNMSLGVVGYAGQMIEPVRNAEQAGTLVVSSSGNSGPDTSGSPANVYDSFAVGATDESESVASFSSGETVDTDAAWGYLAPDDWPGSYVVPDASAPGVDVMSAYPTDHSDGPYHAISGTSMASPHVAGLVGLMESAADEESENGQLKAALTTTAWKPDGNPDDPDTRYGHGIVDAMAAVGRFAADSGVKGTVTDPDGNLIEGATVELDGFPTETHSNGEYTLRAVAGTYELAIDAFGHDAETVSVEVGDGFVTRDFALGDDLAVATVADQPDGLQAGESFDVEVRVANLETLTVGRVGDYEGDVWLSVNDEDAAFGEPISFDAPVSDVVTLTVETGENGFGDLELEHTFEGLGETVSVTTGPTSVYENATPVAIVEADSGGYAADVQAILDEQMHPRYHFSVIDPEAALAAAKNREHGAYVVQSFGDDTELVSEFASVATAPDVGVVYLDQFGEASDAVSQLSAATDDPRDTFDALVEMGSPPVEYQTDRNHPALDGIAEAGDSVTISEPQPVAIGPGLYVGGFHTYFEDFHGYATSAVLGETATGFTASGDGLAVDDLSRVVLASSLGVGMYVGRSAFTADGKALLGNLVAHAAKTPPIEVAHVPSEKITPGESVTAEVDVSDLVELQVGVSGLKFLSKDDLTLSVNGEQVPFDEPITHDSYEGTVEMTVDTAGNAIGEFALDTRFITLDRRDREVETAATFHATTVYESPVRVPDQLDDLQAAVDFVRSGDTVVVGDGTYAVDADRGFQTGLYVGTPGITIRGADGATPEIVHPRDLPSPYVVNVDADDVTLENLAANVRDGEIDPKNKVGFGVVVNELVSGTTIRDVTAAGTSGVFLDVDVSDVHVEGVTVFDSPIGVGTDLSGGPVADVTVTDLTFEDPYFFGWGAVYLKNATRTTVTNCDVTYGEGYTAGILVHGAFDGSENNRIADNSIVGPDDADPFSGDDNGIYVDGAEVEITDNTITDTYVGIRVGEFGFGLNPPSVTIAENTVENADTGFAQFGDQVSLKRNSFTGATGLDLSGGYFGLDANAILARFNDFSGTDVPFVGTPSDGYGAPEGPYDVRQNYLGERSYGDTIADGDLAYDPFLTVSPEEADLPEPTQIATDLYLDAGTSYGLGVPGPTDATIYEILDEERFREFAGDIEYWHQKSGRWKRVTGNGKLATVDTLSAFKVTPSEGVRAVVDFQRRGDTPPGLRDKSPGSADLGRGTNVVAAPTYGDAGAVFDDGAIESVTADLQSPARQLGDGEREAFTGYTVSAAKRTQLDAGLDAYDPTMVELYKSLGLDPVIHEALGPDATASEVTATVADVLDAAPDEETAADAVAALVGGRIARSVEPTDDSEAVAEAVESVVAEAIEEAPAADRDLVEKAAIRVAVEAVRADSGAVVVEDPDADFQTEASRVAAEESKTASLKRTGSVSADD